jgi:hypothetical protein
MCSEMVSSSCLTRCTRCATLVTNPVISQRTGLWLRQTEHIRCHLWHRHSVTNNQGIIATVKLSKFNQCSSPLMLWVQFPLLMLFTRCNPCGKVCRWLEVCPSFSVGGYVSSINKIDNHDDIDCSSEIFFKVAPYTSGKIWSARLIFLFFWQCVWIYPL